MINRQKKRGDPPVKVGLPLRMNPTRPSCLCRTAGLYPQDYDTIKRTSLQAKKYNPEYQKTLSAVPSAEPTVPFGLPLLRRERNLPPQGQL